MNPIAEITYALCALTALACAILMARGFLRSRSRILLWSLVSFVFLAANNVLLFLDKIVFDQVNLLPYRDFTSFLAVAVLVAGIIWDGD